MEKTIGYVLDVLVYEFILFILGTTLGRFVTPDKISHGASLIGVFLGLPLGCKLAQKSDLPDSFPSRFWPLLAPLVCLTGKAVVENFQTGNASYYGNKAALVSAMFAIIPFIIAFSATRAFMEKRLPDMGWAIPASSIIALLAAVFLWQTEQYMRNTMTTRYYGPTVLSDIDLTAYLPSDRPNRLARLGEPPSLRISENYPTLDGATSSFPIYAAVVNEVYSANSKEDLYWHLYCSRTSEAYNRLVRGEVDVIFVLQPSDGQIQAARDAGAELSLTPIAKDAFVFFVNTQNPVSNLSVGQIQDIYTKKITNWREVGGEDRKILPFQRPEDSGSQTAMIKEVMKGIALPPPLKDEYRGTMGGMIRGVAEYRDYAESIGYSFRFFTREMVKFENLDSFHNKVIDRHIARDGSRIKILPTIGRTKIAPDGHVSLLSIDGVAPTEENILNGAYPFTVEIYAVTAGTKNPHVRELIDWLLSRQGQELIERTGYVGIH
jgi:phosphate transport system substrate-binding protein